MDIQSVIDEFVELELECGQLEGSLSSAQRGLDYARGKGYGWEESVDYASKKVNSIDNKFQLKQMQHSALKDQYTSMAKNMSGEQLAKVLNMLGKKASQGKDYKSQAYGMVYNDLYNIYEKKLGSYHR